jgi:LacI family transcriptional regulator
LKGYFEGLKKHKIKADAGLIVGTDLSKQKTREAMQKLLSLKNRPTAVIAFNDYVGLEAAKFCREQKLKINKDISFVSYANLPVTSYLDDAPLASVEQFPYEQSEKAASILLRLIHDKADESIPRKTVLESKVVKNIKQ